MPLWQKIVRGTARVVGMTAAGAAAGFLGFPLGPALIGPAIVAVDKICGIGAHPEKTFARHMGDIMGAMIPGAGVVNYLDYRNNSLTTGLPLQPIAPYVPKTVPVSAVDAPARAHSITVLAVAPQRQAAVATPTRPASGHTPAALSRSAPAAGAAAYSPPPVGGRSSSMGAIPSTTVPTPAARRSSMASVVSSDTASTRRSSTSAAGEHLSRPFTSSAVSVKSSVSASVPARHPSTPVGGGHSPIAAIASHETDDPRLTRSLSSMTPGGRERVGRKPGGASSRRPSAPTRRTPADEAASYVEEAASVSSSGSAVSPRAVPGGRRGSRGSLRGG
jgi:hypothetical protein